MYPSPVPWWTGQPQTHPFGPHIETRGLCGTPKPPEVGAGVGVGMWPLSLRDCPPLVRCVPPPCQHVLHTVAAPASGQRWAAEVWDSLLLAHLLSCRPAAGWTAALYGCWQAVEASRSPCGQAQNGLMSLLLNSLAKASHQACLYSRGRSDATSSGSHCRVTLQGVCACGGVASGTLC